MHAIAEIANFRINGPLLKRALQPSISIRRNGPKAPHDHAATFGMFSDLAAWQALRSFIAPPRREAQWMKPHEPALNRDDFAQALTTM